MSKQVPKDSFDKVWVQSMRKSIEITNLNAKLEQLRETLRTAIEAARERQHDWWISDDHESANKALLEAARILGVE